NPYVDVLNHPTGRMLLRRPGYQIDLEEVMEASADCCVALEINGQPDRLDLDEEWVQWMRVANVLLACTSDAHSDGQLENIRYATAVARRGWAEPHNIVNMLPLAQVLRHLGRWKPRNVA
ncbi:MAG: DNA polymerase III, partial [Dehalococcoidia bacterium]|nr:DNA polymerase III [Dehalococcoidia bacterium]